jgi:DNA-binding NarL/FixJ family response regulator
MNDLIPSASVEGRCLYHGHDLYGPDVDPVEVRKRIGMVFQKPNPFPKSIFDNVAFGPRVLGLPDVKERVERALRSAALWDEVRDRLDENAYGMSGGQQQRLCIARCIAVDPDVILMDVRMPQLDGLEATRRVFADPALQRTRILILTTFDLDEYVYDALRAGASGFLLKDTRPRDLLHAIEVVAAGDAMIAPRITRRLIAEFAARRDPATPPVALAELTDREREVLRLVAHGLSNAEIAGRLVISPLTAKTHVSNILQKLDRRDRAALVALAYETGLVAPGDPP